MLYFLGMTGIWPISYQWMKTTQMTVWSSARRSEACMGTM